MGFQSAVLTEKFFHSVFLAISLNSDVYLDISRELSVIQNEISAKEVQELNVID